MIRASPRRVRLRARSAGGQTGLVTPAESGTSTPVMLTGAGLAPGECVEFSLCARHLLPAGMLGAEEDANVEQMFVAVSEKDELRHVWGRLSLPASVVAELRQLIRLLPSRRHHWRGAVVALREPP